MAKKQMEFDEQMLESVELNSTEAKKIVNTLDAYVLPGPDPKKTQHLIGVLTTQLPQPVESTKPLELQAKYSLGYLVRLGFAQVSPKSLPFWWLGLVLALMGSAWHSMGATKAYPWPPLLLAMPLLAIAATSWVFRPRERALVEIEATCPVGPGQIALTQLLAALIFIILLAVPATILVSSYSSSTQLVSLLFGWLVPMLLFTALTLRVSVSSNGLIGLVTGLTAWGFHVLSFFMDLPLLAPPQSPRQWLVSTGLVLVSLLLLGNAGRKILPERGIQGA